jgi:hypothetical protein
VLGHRKDLPAPTYPKPVSRTNGARQNHPTVWDAIGDLPDIERIDGLLDTDRYFGRLGLASPLAPAELGIGTDLAPYPTDVKAAAPGCSGYRGIGPDR